MSKSHLCFLFCEQSFCSICPFFSWAVDLLCYWYWGALCTLGGKPFEIQIANIFPQFVTDFISCGSIYQSFFITWVVVRKLELFPTLRLKRINPKFSSNTARSCVSLVSPRKLLSPLAGTIMSTSACHPWGLMSYEAFP